MITTKSVKDYGVSSKHAKLVYTKTQELLSNRNLNHSAASEEDYIEEALRQLRECAVI